MRVLHLVAGNLFGGIESLLVTLARSAPQSGSMAAEYGVFFEDRLAMELRRCGATVHVLGAARVSRPTTLVRARHRLRDLLGARDFDVVVCHAAWPYALSAAVVKSAGLPLVFWQHDATSGRHWLERWARLIAPDLVICNSRFTMSTAGNIHPGARAQVIYCPVDFPSDPAASPPESARAELSTPENAVVIVQVGRLEAWKGHALHLEALHEIADLPNWVCWIVGGPQRTFEVRYLESLKALARQYSLENRVHFLGIRHDVPRLLASADIFCQPNTGPEPFGIVFVEALLSGLPVVTSAMGGAEEIVDESCGILIGTPQPRNLANALRKLIQDPELRERLRGAGPSRARELCDARTQVRRLEAALHDLLRTRSEPPGLAASSVGRLEPMS
jgi:glycosyltransferase involved in cell wall biosynthesis